MWTSIPYDGPVVGYGGAQTDPDWTLGRGQAVARTQAHRLCWGAKPDANSTDNNIYGKMQAGLRRQRKPSVTARVQMTNNTNT